MDANRHFYLYAKGHYLMGNMIADLLKIQSYRTSVPVESLRPYHVYDTVMRLAYAHILHEQHFMRFGEWIARTIEDENVNFIEASISAALTVLALAKVKDIPFSLGFADSEVLPLKDNNA